MSARIYFLNWGWRHFCAITKVCLALKKFRCYSGPIWRITKILKSKNKYPKIPNIKKRNSYRKSSRKFQKIYFTLNLLLKLRKIQNTHPSTPMETEIGNQFLHQVKKGHTQRLISLLDQNIKYGLPLARNKLILESLLTRIK